MKNLSIALNVVLIIAVAVLYFLHFDQGKQVVEKNTAVNADSDTIVETTEAEDGQIAYIFTDSLLLKYELYSVLEDEFIKKQNSLEASVERKAKAFQDDYVKFMEKVQRGAFLSQERAQEEEQQLLKRQQELEMYQQDASISIAESRQSMEKQLNDTLISYLKELKAYKNYKFVLNAGLSCLYVDEGLDITKEVTDSLNKRYNAYKEEEKVAEEATQ